jgi:N-acetylglucosaminyl-diphospho-decaprenol L-rhamnosyltransferase
MALAFQTVARRLPQAARRVSPLAGDRALRHARRVQPRITVISVAYHSAAVLPAMLASLPPGTPTIIVDNASADADALPAGTIRNARNLGFGAACNIGAARAGTEFLFFLNPDARLEPGALDALLAAADAHPEAVAFNPRIIQGDPPRPFFRRRSDLLPRSAFLPRGIPEADCAVPVLHGSALLVRRAAFEALGGFDERLFLYYEDDDLSVRLAALGPLRWVHGAVVRHISEASSQGVPGLAAFKARQMARARIYAMRKHGRAWPLLRTLGTGLGRLGRVCAGGVECGA